MNSKWFLHNGLNRIGPLSLEEAKQHIHSGEYTEHNFCWREGMGNWKRIVDEELLRPAPAVVIPLPTFTNQPILQPHHPDTGMLPPDLSVFMQMPQSNDDKTSKIDFTLLKKAEKKAYAIEKHRSRLEMRSAQIEPSKSRLKPILLFLLFICIIIFIFTQLQSN